MKRIRFLLPIILVFVAGISLLLQREDTVPVNKGSDTSFNRNLRPIIYTKHARCRMDCRRIDESEIEDILVQGVVNDSKTNIHAKPDPKYALEGRTRDNQLIRVIFAPSAKGMVVITCIDLETEWSCDCK